MRVPKRLATIALLLSACGTAPHATQPLPGTLGAQADSVGSYLSLEFTPTQAIRKQAASTLASLGFLDVSHAVPPRDPSVYHATVAFFTQPLTADQVTLITEHFKGEKASLTVTGWGVAGEQVAFMTVDGIQPARDFLTAHGLKGAMDDPHVTIGVSPARPQDVHGVPKLPQHAFTPMKVGARYQLYLPAKGEMTARWP